MTPRRLRRRSASLSSRGCKAQRKKVRWPDCSPTLDQIARETRRADFIVSVPVDTPFVSHDLVVASSRCIARKTMPAPTSPSRPRARGCHHAVALWPVRNFRQHLRAAFAAGERSVGRFAAQHRIVQVEWPVANQIDPFFNINTPNDLATAEALHRADAAYPEYECPHLRASARVTAWPSCIDRGGNIDRRQRVGRSARQRTSPDARLA